MTIPSAFVCAADRYYLNRRWSRSLRSHKSINKTFGHSAGNYLSLLGALVLLVLSSSVAFAQYGKQDGGGSAKLTIKSSVLGEDRTILVRTPAGYETNKIAYPVLYMTDGNAHIAHTASTIEFLARNGRMSEMIVVGITNTDRTRDLTPTKGTGPNATQSPTAGGADNFLKFIETEVIPQIEKNYRVQPYRVLAGHSFGGLFAVHALITRPELGAAVVVSRHFHLRRHHHRLTSFHRDWLAPLHFQCECTFQDINTHRETVCMEQSPIARLEARRENAHLLPLALGSESACGRIDKNLRAITDPFRFPSTSQ
ncbi:MAG: alpha/beta hydrolase [Pyrinomonadaceae bacterium]